jgi:uncharacterized protein YjbK
MSERHTSGREVELKLRVDDLAALMTIAAAAGGRPAPTVLQENSYFDTVDRALGVAGLVLRLRMERSKDSARFLLTGKGPGSRSGSLTSVREEELEVPRAVADAIRAGTTDPVAELERDGPPSRRALAAALREARGAGTLVCLGTFLNERTCVPATLEDGELRFAAVLELDRTSFPGGLVHHEVEMEVPPGVDPARAQRAFDALFARAGVHGRVSTGKARRFFGALKGASVEGRDVP